MKLFTLLTCCEVQPAGTGQVLFSPATSAELWWRSPNDSGQTVGLQAIAAVLSGDCTVLGDVSAERLMMLQPQWEDSVCSSKDTTKHCHIFQHKYNSLHAVYALSYLVNACISATVIVMKEPRLQACLCRAWCRSCRSCLPPNSVEGIARSRSTSHCCCWGA